MSKLHLTLIFMAALLATLTVNQTTAAEVAYIPGLGEFMTAIQMRHSKLWFAGQARNWALAAYELDEIREGFEDIKEFHPIHEGSPVPINELLPKLTDDPLTRLQRAVSSQNPEEFDGAFDSLTAACNACHQAENFGFNVITRPKANPFTNQDFAPPRSVRSGNYQKPNKLIEQKPKGAAH